MSSGAIPIWIVQAIVTWWVFRDLSPRGSRFLAGALGIESDFWIWTCLIALALFSMLANSRIAANAYSAIIGKRPGEDWPAYSQSGGSAACYWCGLISFGSCFLVVPRILQRLSVPGAKAGGLFVLTLVVNTLLIRVVVRILFRRRYGRALNFHSKGALSGPLVRNRPRGKVTGNLWRYNLLPTRREVRRSRR
jgi:hypothetical protein